jgi:hypothetical protein
MACPPAQRGACPAWSSLRLRVTEQLMIWPCRPYPAAPAFLRRAHNPPFVPARLPRFCPRSIRLQLADHASTARSGVQQAARSGPERCPITGGACG